MKSHPSDHLANERTFLAYVRTAFAFIGFGFVVARFGVFVREVEIAQHAAPRTAPTSTTLGIAMVAVGVAIAAFGLYRFARVERALVTGGAAALSMNGAAAIVAVVTVIGLAAAYFLSRTGPS